MLHSLSRLGHLYRVIVISELCKVIFNKAIIHGDVKRIFQMREKNYWSTLVPLISLAAPQRFKCSTTVMLNFGVAQRNICKKKV